jgi:hypothetical protein
VEPIHNYLEQLLLGLRSICKNLLSCCWRFLVLQMLIFLLFHVIRESAMTTDALASVYVLITLTLTYLLTFVNMPTQRMPNDLSHLQGCPAAVLRICCFRYVQKCASLSSLLPCIYCGKNGQNHSSGLNYLARPRRLLRHWCITMSLYQWSL